MTFELVMAFGAGVALGAIVAGAAVWHFVSRRAPVKPPGGKVGDRHGRHSVPSERYPLW